MLQVLTIGVGLWLSLTLLVVAYLIGKNLIAQQLIMKTVTFYLSRQHEMMAQLLAQQAERVSTEGQVSVALTSTRDLRERQLAS